jgi:hypothetical protein
MEDTQSIAKQFIEVGKQISRRLGYLGDIL